MKLAHDDQNKFTNVMPGEKFTDVLLETGSYLASILKEHFGALGNDGVVLRAPATEATVVPKYTMDGREIVDAVEFRSPVQEYIRREVATVGRWVDSKSGDGTTTSMLLACNIAKELTKELKTKSNDPSDGDKKEVVSPLVHTPYSKTSEAFEYVCGELVRVLEKRAKAQSDRTEDLIYAQALASSHGDEELANCVAEAMKHTGATTECIGFAQRTKQSDPNKRFYTKVSEYQYTVDARPKVYGYYEFNQSLGESHEESNALGVCTITPMVQGSAFTSPEAIDAAIHSIIESASEKPNSIVFLTTKVDAYTSKMLNEIGIEGYGVPVYVFEYGSFKTSNLIEAHPEKVKEIHVSLPALIAGKQVVKLACPQNFENYAFPCSFRYIGHKLSFGNLVEIPEGNPKHPDVDDPTTGIGDVVQYARETRDYYTENGDVLGAKDLVDMYTEIIRDATYMVTPVIYIGGVNTEKMSSFEVVKDVIGSTRAALESGSVLSPVDQLQSIVSLGILRFKDPLHRAVYKVISNALTDVPGHGDEIMPHQYAFVDRGGKVECYHCTSDLTSEVGKAVDRGQYIVMQPLASISAMFEAIRFTILRMACVREVIVPGYVVPMGPGKGEQKNEDRPSWDNETRR